MPTHQEQILLDLVSLFTTSEWGRPAVFVPGAGPAVETTVIKMPDQGMEAAAYGENPADTDIIHVMTSAIPEAENGDRIRLTDTDEAYTVIRVARRSVGRMALACTRNERVALK